MFRWIFAAALALSLLFCAVADFGAQSKLREAQKRIAEKTAEVKPLHDLVQEIAAYQTKKDALQKRIDFINQLKIRQQGPALAIAALDGAKTDDVESAAVIDPKTIVINTRTGAKRLEGQ